MANEVPKSSKVTKTEAKKQRGRTIRRTHQINQCLVLLLGCLPGHAFPAKPLGNVTCGYLWCDLWCLGEVLRLLGELFLQEAQSILTAANFSSRAGAGSQPHWYGWSRLVIAPTTVSAKSLTLTDLQAIRAQFHLSKDGLGCTCVSLPLPEHA